MLEMHIDNRVRMMEKSTFIPFGGSFTIGQRERGNEVITYCDRFPPDYLGHE